MQDVHSSEHDVDSLKYQ